jgi:hypothetical protein
MVSPSLHQCPIWQPTRPDQLQRLLEGNHVVAREWRMTVPAFTVLAEPHFFQAGQSSTSLA